MATGFYLDRGSVWVRYRQQYNGQQFSLFYYPGIIIEDPEAFTAGKAPSYSDPKIDRRLRNIRTAIEEVIDENDPLKLTNDLFGRLINEKLKHKKEANKKGDDGFTKTAFLPFARAFADDKERNKEKVGCKDWKSIKSLVNMVEEFNPKLTFEQIDRKFDEKFLAFLQDEKDASDNYIAKLYGNLKRILDKATKEEINTKLDYLLFEKKKRRQVVNVYLNETQLEIIYNLKLEVSKDPKADYLRLTGKTEGVKSWTHEQYRECVSGMIRSLDNVRKLLIIGCWTGLRGDNFLNIIPRDQISWNDKIKKYEVSAIANKGTGLVTIPAHWTVAKIYESTWPFKISLKTFNEQVKTLGRLAGLTQPVLLDNYRGGKQISETKLFYELLASHTCRRSFCSNLLINNFPIQTIMSFSGHSTEKSFNIYTAHVTKEIRTAKASEHPMWNEPKESTF